AVGPVSKTESSSVQIVNDPLIPVPHGYSIDQVFLRPHKYPADVHPARVEPRGGDVCGGLPGGPTPDVYEPGVERVPFDARDRRSGNPGKKAHRARVSVGGREHLGLGAEFRAICWKASANAERKIDDD